MQDHSRISNTCDGNAVLASLDALDPATLRGDWVSPRDRSPLRRGGRLAEDIGTIAAFTAEQLIASRRHDQAKRLLARATHIAEAIPLAPETISQLEELKRKAETPPPIVPGSRQKAVAPLPVLPDSLIHDADEPLPGPGTRVVIDQLPLAITKASPTYPAEARRKRIQGTVLAQALVSPDGTVAACRIIQSIPGLDESACGAVKRWRFKPAMAQGRPVAIWIAVPVRFSLDD